VAAEVTRETFLGTLGLIYYLLNCTIIRRTHRLSRATRTGVYKRGRAFPVIAYTRCALRSRVPRRENSGAEERDSEARSDK